MRYVKCIFKKLVWDTCTSEVYTKKYAL